VAKEFHGMLDDTPQPLTMGGNLDTNQSTPILLFTESTTTSSVNQSKTLLEVLDEAHYQLGTALDCIEVLTEVIRQLEKQDSILIGTNEAMAKRKHAVKERLDSLI
jgi:hypothetical protein